MNNWMPLHKRRNKKTHMVCSQEYKTYCHKKQSEKRKIFAWQIGILAVFLILWEVGARTGILNSFLFSSPSAVFILLMEYVKDGSLFIHMWISVWETILGFLLGTILGVLIAIFLWWSEFAAKVLSPALVVLNALPKTALAPILIVWVGAGMWGIVVTAITISLVTTILSAYNYFLQVEEEQIRMLQSFGATKFQILTKLILPSNRANIVSITKINIGLAWVGVIVGEFIVSRNGLGYLIVYGGQVFRLDLVMMGVVVLAFCAFLMYALVNIFEKWMKSLTK